MTASRRHIHLLAALPQEYKPFLRLFPGNWRLQTRNPFRQYVGSKGNDQFHLTETGMGRRAIRDALAWILCGSPRPDLLVSFGYAGSLCPGLKVGDVCLVRRVACWELSLNGEVSVSGQFEANHPEELWNSALAQGVKSADLVTVKTLQPKELLSSFTAGADVLVDMESFHVAKAACAENIPLLCLRSVSDGLEDRILLDPATLVDHRGRLSPRRVLFQLLTRPALLPFLLKSWRNASQASAALASVLQVTCSLPADSLKIRWTEAPKKAVPPPGRT